MAIQSIIAGCGQSTTFTKVLLYGILQVIEDRYIGIKAREWIDDIRLSQIGCRLPYEEHGEELLACAKALVLGLKNWGAR